MLGQDRSGYSRIGQVILCYIRLIQVMIFYAKLGQDTIG